MVHYGTLTECEPGHSGYNVTLENTRRIWSWAGASSLSELAFMGTADPGQCNFSLPVSKNKLVAIEIISMTEAAIKNIEAVDYWAFSKDSTKIAEIASEIKESTTND